MAALAVAVLALVLSLYGAWFSELHLAGSRLNEARNQPGAEFTRDSEAARVTVAVVAYAIPFALGLAAAVLGGRASKALAHHPADHTGHLAAVFAVMVGALAAVVSGCMIFAVYGWPLLPAALTG